VNDRKVANWIFKKQDVAMWTGIKLSAYDVVAGSWKKLYFSSIPPLLHAADTILKCWAHLNTGKEFCLSKQVK
jgi:hypothetical protein